MMPGGYHKIVTLVVLLTNIVSDEFYLLSIYKPCSHLFASFLDFEYAAYCRVLRYAMAEYRRPLQPLTERLDLHGRSITIRCCSTVVHVDGIRPSGIAGGSVSSTSSDFQSIRTDLHLSTGDGSCWSRPHCLARAD